MTELTGPNDEHRTIVLGRTGSGKTQFSCDMLSTRNFDQIPWVVIDYKREEFFSDLLKRKYARPIKCTDKPPQRPGVYIMRPSIKIDDDAVETFMLKCLDDEDIGIYIDEGYALPQRDAFDLILTQGRSKHVPVIALYQRPVWMSRFAVAQADFFAAFEQNDMRDVKSIMNYIRPVKLQGGGRLITPNDGLPKYHCIWYEVGEGRSTVLRPCRSKAEILEHFRQRLAPGGQRRAFI